MSKDEVITKIKAILDKDPRFKGTDIKVKFTDKKDKSNEEKNKDKNNNHKRDNPRGAGVIKTRF